MHVITIQATTPVCSSLLTNTHPCIYTHRLAALQSSAGGGPVAREAVEVLEDLLQQGDSSDNPDLQVGFARLIEQGMSVCMLCVTALLRDIRIHTT